MGDAAEKFRAWKANHPESYETYRQRRRERYLLAGGTGRQGAHPYHFRAGKRGQWAVYTLCDPGGPDSDLPRAVLAARDNPAMAIWQREWSGPLGKWLRSWERPPAARRVLGGLSRRTAIAVARAEADRMSRLLGTEWVGVQGAGGLCGVSWRLAGWRV